MVRLLLTECDANEKDVYFYFRVQRDLATVSIPSSRDGGQEFEGEGEEGSGWVEDRHEPYRSKTVMRQDIMPVL